MNPRPLAGFYTDPKPYRRRTGVRPWSRRWSVEFWADDGEHDFRRFFTRRAAVRWAEAHMGEQWKAMVVSAGATAPMPPRWDLFVVVDPAIDDAPVMVAEVDRERGTIRYVHPPGRSQADAQASFDAAVKRGAEAARRKRRQVEAPEVEGEFR